MSNRKAVGLSMNMLVLLILGLVVVIIISAVGYGKVRFFQSNIDSKEACEARGGSCMAQASCKTNSMVSLGCADEQVCCLNLCVKNSGTCKKSCEDSEIAYNSFYCDGDDNNCCIAKEVKKNG